MQEQQLREHLEQLAEAVKAMEAPAEEKARLSSLIEDLEQQLGNPLLAEESQTLVDQVDSMVSSFEQQHPTISGILNNIMVTLTSMGV